MVKLKVGDSVMCTRSLIAYMFSVGTVYEIKGFDARGDLLLVDNDGICSTTGKPLEGHIWTFAPIAGQQESTTSMTLYVYRDTDGDYVVLTTKTPEVGTQGFAFYATAMVNYSSLGSAVLDLASPAAWRVHAREITEDGIDRAREMFKDFRYVAEYVVPH